MCYLLGSSKWEEGRQSLLKESRRILNPDCPIAETLSNGGAKLPRYPTCRFDDLELGTGRGPVFTSRGRPTDSKLQVAFYSLT